MINNKFNDKESMFHYKEDSQNSHNNQELTIFESKSDFGSKNRFSYGINKIKITSARFNNIKDYILENTDNIPDDLTQREIHEIISIRNKYKQNSQFLKNKKSHIDKNKEELKKKEAEYFDAYYKVRSLKERFEALEKKIYIQALQINELKPNFKWEFLNEDNNNFFQYRQYLSYMNALEQKLLQKEKVKSEWKWLNEDNYPDKSEKIDLIQKDILLFINEIEKSPIKSKIANLEQDLLQKRLFLNYQEKHQQTITEDYEEKNQKYQQTIISKLKYLYDIT
ncbi:hypothetical protein [Candidatus Phytoplasma fabacearum]|nr:hypothetical protein ['Bituminaria bituminosa' little leaf phytoplasma]